MSLFRPVKILKILTLKNFPITPKRLELMCELQMDVEYSYFGREQLKVAFKHLCQLPLKLLKLILCRRLWLQACKMGGALIQWGRGALRIYSIVTELETLYNFVHVGFLKLRMSTGEMYLNSLHVSKLNSESTALQWKLYRNRTST